MHKIKFHKYDIIKIFIFLPLFITAVYSLTAKGEHSGRELIIVDSAACEELGEALFSDARFSSPDGKLSGLKQDENSRFTVSCKSCHMVDEKLKEKGMRGYTDFSKRTAIPYRNGDAEPLQFTHRRTQQLINIAGQNIGSSPVYHWDGEFDMKSSRSSLIKLIEKTFTSRNMGWRSGEEEKSSAMRLRYILEESYNAAGNSGEEKPSYIEQYSKVFGLTRNDFFKLSGEEILDLCNLAIAFYIENISSDIESPFDIFLKENGIEDPLSADEKILEEFLSKKEFIFINKTVPVLKSEITVSRKVKFGKKELNGLRLFMNKEKTNCSSCHTPPSFTDNNFYNIGVSEFDYKDVHGNFPGKFYSAENLVKTLSSVDKKSAAGKFQKYPQKNAAGDIDLGRALFSGEIEGNIGAFRTPGLRNLKYSGPYFHSGRAETLHDAVLFHIEAASIRNELKFVSKKLGLVPLSDEEIKALIAFIGSLNDHYE